jgi:hypothetical protein
MNSLASIAGRVPFATISNSIMQAGNLKSGHYSGRLLQVTYIWFRDADAEEYETHVTC